MKLLKIEANQGHFLSSDNNYEPVDTITKDDLLRLVDLTLNEENVEYDEYDEETIRNQAHQIVYKNVYEKLQNLRGRKKEFVDESERLFLQEYEKYREDASV